MNQKISLEFTDTAKSLFLSMQPHFSITEGTTKIPSHEKKIMKRLKQVLCPDLLHFITYTAWVGRCGVLQSKRKCILNKLEISPLIRLIYYTVRCH